MSDCILVVDDDREIVKAISILLEGEGYEVLKAYDGLQALDILASRQVRLGLSMGADDYVCKPYNPQELAARVKSQLRRYTCLGDIHAGSRIGEIRNGRLVYRTDEKILYADGEPVRLTAKETGIIELLMRNPGRIFPAEEIYRRVWDEEAWSSEGTVMVHIRRIREKIELNPREPDYLKVVWGIGYKMEKH